MKTSQQKWFVVVVIGTIAIAALRLASYDHFDLTIALSGVVLFALVRGGQTPFSRGALSASYHQRAHWSLLAAPIILVLILIALFVA